MKETGTSARELGEEQAAAGQQSSRSRDQEGAREEKGDILKLTQAAGRTHGEMQAQNR